MPMIYDIPPEIICIILEFAGYYSTKMALYAAKIFWVLPTKQLREHMKLYCATCDSVCIKKTSPESLESDFSTHRLPAWEVQKVLPKYQKKYRSCTSAKVRPCPCIRAMLGPRNSIEPYLSEHDGDLDDYGDYIEPFNELGWPCDVRHEPECTCNCMRDEHEYCTCKNVCYCGSGCECKYNEECTCMCDITPCECTCDCQCMQLYDHECSGIGSTHITNAGHKCICYETNHYDRYLDNFERMVIEKKRVDLLKLLIASGRNTKKLVKKMKKYALHDDGEHGYVLFILNGYKF